MCVIGPKFLTSQINYFFIQSTQCSDYSGKVWIACSIENSNENEFSMLDLYSLLIDNAQLFEFSTYNNVAVLFRNSVIR